MYFEVGRIDGDGLVVAGFRRQTHHNPREHAHIAPPVPLIVERFVRATLRGASDPRKPLGLRKKHLLTRI